MRVLQPGDHRIGEGTVQPLPARSGFTLLEMLVAISIIIILITLAVRGMGNVLDGRRMEEAGRIALDEINLARQLAASRNLNVEVRFIKKPRSTAASATYHALQRGMIEKDGTFTPITGITALPDGIIFAPEGYLSSMIDALPKRNDSSGYTYTSVVIRPTGMIEPQPGLALNVPWFVTAIYEKDIGKGEENISNFVTLQIDPWTSRPVLYRP